MSMTPKMIRLMLISLIILAGGVYVFGCYCAIIEKVKERKFNILSEASSKLSKKEVKNILKSEEKRYELSEMGCDTKAQDFFYPLRENESEGSAKAQEEIKHAGLAAEPEEINIEVENGQTAKAKFQLKNNGTKPVLINIYKARDDESEYEQLEDFIKYKKGVFSDPSLKGDLAKAALFSGVPWLKQFPCYCVLEVNESRNIELTVVAGELDVKEYNTYLFIVGEGKRENLILPVNVEVKAAPKIKLIRLEVDDGFSADTRGNLDNTANPGERVVLTMIFENTGSAEAEDLTMKISSDESCVHVLDSGLVGSPYAEAKGRFSAKAVIEVSKSSYFSTPPGMNLEITDRKGRKWAESFYLGEEGKFEYPTGLLPD